MFFKPKVPLFWTLAVADLPSKNELKTLQTIFKAYIVSMKHGSMIILTHIHVLPFFENSESTISFYIVGSHQMQKDISPA